MTQEGNRAPRVDAAKCVDCGLCVQSCPMAALQI